MQYVTSKICRLNYSAYSARDSILYTPNYTVLLLMTFLIALFCIPALALKAKMSQLMVIIVTEY